MNALIILVFVVMCAVGAAVVLNQASTWLYSAMSWCARTLSRWTVRYGRDQVKE